MSSLKTSNIKKCNDDNDCSKFNKVKIKYHCDKVRKICTKQKERIKFANEIQSVLTFDKSPTEKFIYKINNFNNMSNKYVFQINRLSDSKKTLINHDILIKNIEQHNKIIKIIDNELSKISSPKVSSPKASSSKVSSPKVSSPKTSSSKVSSPKINIITDIRNNIITNRKYFHDILNINKHVEKQAEQKVRNLMTLISNDYRNIILKSVDWSSLTWNSKLIHIKSILNNKFLKNKIPDNIKKLLNN